MSVMTGTPLSIFRFRVPRPPLDALVAGVWFCRNAPQEHALERLAPSGAPQLIVNLKEDRVRIYDHSGLPSSETAGTVLVGTRSGPQIIDTAEQEYVAGVAFRPGGAVAFVPAPAHETADLDVPLDLMWQRRDVMRLRERLLECRTPDAALDALEHTLREQLRPGRQHPAVGYALGQFQRFRGQAAVTAVTDAVGLSAKRFIERFKAEVGVTPKVFCRIRRFQRVLSCAHSAAEVDWAQLAAECGYFDQAHLIRDFRAFAGITPTKYRESRTGSPNHVKFVQ